MKRIFAAVLFALLITTAPAHATTVPNAIEEVNITFADGYVLTGQMQWQYFSGGPYCCGLPGPPTPGYGFPSPGPAGLFLNGGAFVAGVPHADGVSLNAVFIPPGGGPVDIYANLADLPNNLTVADFSINSSYPSYPPTDGSPGISGTVSCVSGCLSPVPLPVALPLFGSGVVALAGLAWRSRRKVSA
jgi:hypothetical protein